MSKGFASNFRMTLLAVGVLGFFAAVGGRLVYLHVLHREELLKFVNKARRQIVVEHARRGALLDTKGNVLATSRSYIVLGADPEMLKEADSTKWAALARLLNTNYLELDKTLRKNIAASQLALASRDEAVKDKRVRYVKLADEVDEAVYDQIMDLKIRGIYGSRGYKRVYPGNQLAAHVIGYINKENIPVTGAEKHLDLYLKGQDGWIESEKDGARREMAQFRTREVDPQDGNDVVLTHHLGIFCLQIKQVRLMWGGVPVAAGFADNKGCKAILQRIQCRRPNTARRRQTGYDKRIDIHLR